MQKQIVPHFEQNFCFLCRTIQAHKQTNPNWLCIIKSQLSSQLSMHETLFIRTGENETIEIQSFFWKAIKGN